MNKIFNAARTISTIRAIRTAGLLLVSLFLFSGCDNRSQNNLSTQDTGNTYKWSGQTMGTYYRITLIKSAENSVLDLAVAKQQVDKTLQSIIDSMSTYKSDSEITRFNQLTAPACLVVSQDLLDVVALALEVSEASGGAFNPLVGALVNRWGFGSTSFKASEFQLPTDQEILGLLAATDTSSLRLNTAEYSLCKSAEVALDLSAIAKGYGVDKVAETIEQLGVGDYLIDIGGEVRVKGLNPRGEVWKLAIEKPGLQLGSVQQLVNLDAGAIATSGDYRNFIEHQGIRYSHTIDPRSGNPVRHNLASVSVIAANTALADAWATAFSVMGAEQAQLMAQNMSLAVYLLKRENSAQQEPSYSTWHSAAFSQYMQQ